MKLSTRGRYGLKTAYVLASHYDEDRVQVRQICEEANVTKNYAEQLLAQMRKAEIIDTIRGSQGGYFLKREPSEITVGEVLRAVEGDLGPTDCASLANTCDNLDRCVTRKVWVKMKKGIDDVINSITLQDMLNDDK